MNLYAFQPKGHGQQSFFVMAESELMARKAIDDYIQSKPNPKSYEFQGWGTDYYEMKFLGIGEVIENDND